jgi:BirA family biotin operon repressor/biotin-[acetyl-CoA-carboxylase] ligase
VSATAIAPADLAAAWPGELAGLALLAFDRLDSTQSFARRLLDRFLAEDETPPPCLVVALEQTAGRGRRGRAWSSGAGDGVWASLLVGVDAAELGSVPMRAAVALCESLAPLVGGVRIKWPNDLLVDGRKLGGLLVEAVARGGGRGWAIVGYGVNVHQDADRLPTAQATSVRLAASGRAIDLPALSARLAAGLWRALAGGNPEWLASYRARSAHADGDRLTCELESERLDGRFAGFDENGRLRLDTAAGERVISAGDVFPW